MLYREYPPSITLAPYIHLYGELQYIPQQLAPISEVVPPLLGRGIIFRLSGNPEETILMERVDQQPYSLKMGYVLPMWTEPYKTTYHWPFHMVAVIFRPGQFRHFFKLPMEELVNQVYSFEELGLKELQELHEQLWETQATPQRLSLLEAFFLKKLGKREPSYDFTDHFLNKLPHSFLMDQFQLNRFAKQELYKSPKHMRRLVQNSLGINPKKYESILRFTWSMNQLDRNPEQSFSQIAMEAGYTDLSHFGRQFRKYTGSSPSDFLKAKHPFVDTTKWRDD